MNQKSWSLAQFIHSVSANWSSFRKFCFCWSRHRPSDTPVILSATPRYIFCCIWMIPGIWEYAVQCISCAEATSIRKSMFLLRFRTCTLVYGIPDLSDSLECGVIGENSTLFTYENHAGSPFNARNSHRNLISTSSIGQFLPHFHHHMSLWSFI